MLAILEKIGGYLLFAAVICFLAYAKYSQAKNREEKHEHKSGIRTLFSEDE